MPGLLESIEKRGRAGAGVAVLVAVLALMAAGAITWQSFVLDDGTGPWLVGGLRGVAFVFAATALVFGMVGAKQLQTPSYAPVEELFPSLSRQAFLDAVEREPRPLCACVACRIHLPAQFSTGSCPRCASSVDYYEISTDEDARMVVVATP